VNSILAEQKEKYVLYGTTKTNVMSCHYMQTMLKTTKQKAQKKTKNNEELKEIFITYRQTLLMVILLPC
jgi:endonuclease/exonuclease/phosphatase (EEP) superfamily protein YafD